jgi:hypothetical protein
VQGRRWCPDEVRQDLHGARLRGNIAGVLFSPQANQIVALVRLSSKSSGSNVMIVGSMSSAEISCVQRLIDDDQSASC